MLYVIIICILGLLYCFIQMVRTTIYVFPNEIEALDIISEHANNDIDNGRDWHWRYKSFNKDIRSKDYNQYYWFSFSCKNWFENKNYLKP